MTDLSVAIIDPGNRVEKMYFPLEASTATVSIEPDDRARYDILIADMINPNLGKEVVRKPFEDGALVYRMRGDVFAEMEVWDVSPLKKWVARKTVLPRVDGCLAVTDWMADKYHEKTGVAPVGAAGLPKRIGEWPDVEHRQDEIRATTLTNADYLSKIQALIDWAPTVDTVLDETSGWWEVCASGKYESYLDRALTEYDHVDMVGYVDANEQLARSNAVFHFSYLDGQPNSILEGMASNVPVVTNGFISFRQFDGPAIVCEDADDLVDQLHALTDPGLRAEYGKRGAAHIATNHTCEAIGEQYVDYFEQLLTQT